MIQHRTAPHDTLSRLMLALILSFALGLTSLRAQSNTEYNFRQQSVADGQAYNNNGDPVPVLTDDDQGGGLKIGKNSNSWSVYSDNIITTDIANTADIGLSISGGSGSAYKDMTNNYWGYGYEGSSTSSHFIDPMNQYDWVAYFDDGNLTASAGLPDPGPTPPSMTCGNPDANRVSKGSNHPLSVVSTDTISDSLCFAKIGICDEWVNDLQTNFDVAYDTLRKYLTLCPDAPNALEGLSALEGLCGIATQTKTDAGRLDLRNWLMAERHASTWEGWYCDCVDGMASTFPDIRAALSVLKFLLADSQCSYFDHAYAASYQATRDYQFSIWMDTAKNDSSQYFDSSLIPFDMLGLDSLLDDEANAAVGTNVPQFITYLTASPNPLQGGTVLSFDLTQPAYVKIQVFDELGKLESTEGYIGMLTPGNKSVPISLAGLPSGTYYARIQTAYGGVRTVKLVKE